MHTVIVNRKLKSFRAYGPFTTHTEAWCVAEVLSRRTWVKTTDVITMDAIKVDVVSGALTEIAEV